jgi:hypothetical protein
MHMTLEAIIHATKHFSELEDGDIEAFLRERKFKSEHLNLEFKHSFPLKGGGAKYDIREVCKYIVGLSNEDGGLVVYGVADEIKDPNTPFPKYVTGLACNPSAEDLSQWVKERIHPLVTSPAVRFFEVQGMKVAIFKIPPGVNKPYCYYDPSAKSLSVFKKTAGGIAEVAPDEIWEFFRTQIIEQAAKILRAAELQGGTPHTALTIDEDRLRVRQDPMKAKLENCRDYGFLGIYSQPEVPIDIPLADLNTFLEVHRNHFSESMRYNRGHEPLQDGVSVGYYPRAIRNDIKSTSRLTLYRDGLVALDSQADTLMDKNKTLHPYWLSYELQRHLQLSKTLLEHYQVKTVHLVIELDNIEDFSLSFERNPLFGQSSYSGGHHPIERHVPLLGVHAYDSPERNIVIPVVKDIMDEICRIFGLSKTPPGVWDQKGWLTYVGPGLENLR